MDNSSALSRVLSVASAFTAAKPLGKALSGIGWMLSGGQRLKGIASSVFGRRPEAPLPENLPDEPTARFAAFQALNEISDSEIDARRQSARSFFLSYAIATAMMIFWAIAAPALGMAPGLTAALPWTLAMVFAAKTARWSHIHHHLQHHRLTPFWDWVKDPANLFMPVFESGGTTRAIVHTIGLIIIASAMSPAIAWAAEVGSTSNLLSALMGNLGASDLSYQWVLRIFPSALSSVSGVSPAQDALAQMLGIVNTLLMVACCGMLVYETMSGVVHAAHNGKAFSDKFHGLYAPVRVMIGVGMVVPVAGYCMAQLLVLMVALGGYKMANEVWKGYVQISLGMAQAQGPGMTGAQRWAVAPGGGAITVPPDIISQFPAFQALLSAETCYQAARWASRPQGNTQTPPAQPTIRQSTGLRNGERPIIALPPVSGVDVPGGRRWDYGQACGSITWTVRPASSTTTTTTTGNTDAMGNATPQYSMTVQRQGRLVEREQSMRAFDTARYEAFGRLVQAIRTQRIADWASALGSPGFIPDDTAPDISALMGNVISGYGTFRSEILAASSTLSASLNTDARQAMLSRVDAMGWAAAGAFQPAIVRANKTVVDRVLEQPTVEAMADSISMTPQIREIYSRAQRQLTEALYSAIPNSTPSQRNGATAGGASRGFPEIDAVRDLRSSPETSMTNWLSRISERMFLHLEAMGRIDGTDPLSSIQNHGQLMEATLVTGWGTWVLINTISGSASAAADGLGQSVAGWFGAGAVSRAVSGAIEGAIRAISGLVTSFFWWAMALSALYSTVLPMLGYIFWMFAVAGCIVFLVEGVVGSAFWAFAHVKTDGSGEFVGPGQRHGYVILFNFLFRPMLMVVGLVVGHIVFAVMVSFVNATYGLAAGAAFSGEAFYGSRSMSLVSVLVMMATLLYIHYQLAVRAYSLITELPDRVARWSGASGENLGEEGHFGEANRTIVGGVMMQTRTFGTGLGASRGEPPAAPDKDPRAGSPNPANAVANATGKGTGGKGRENSNPITSAGNKPANNTKD